MSNHRTDFDNHSLHKSVAGLIAASAVVATVLSAAPALADTPTQGGVGDGTSASPGQGGVNSAPAPGPGAIPAPPQEAPYRPVPQYLGGTGGGQDDSGQGGGYSGGNDTTPSYNAPSTYQPHELAPRVGPQLAPVRPIAPPPGDVRIGLFIQKKPAWMSDADANSINAWSAYGEAKISQAWRASGIAPAEADRRAAVSIMGVAAGGTIGAATLGIPAAVVGGVAGAGVGAIAGALIGGIPTQGVMAGPGAAIGAGVGAAAGAAALGIPAAIAGAVGGGLIGGVAGYVLGAGDDKADPNKVPWALPGQPALPPAPAGPNQYELHLPAADAQRAGLPPVDYVVRSNGDVNTDVAGHNLHWTGGQANAGYDALGAAGQNLKQTVTHATKQLGDQAQAAIHGLHITIPGQPPAAPAGGRHRR